MLTAVNGYRRSVIEDARNGKSLETKAYEEKIGAQLEQWLQRSKEYYLSCKLSNDLEATRRAMIAADRSSDILMDKFRHLTPPYNVLLANETDQYINKNLQSASHNLVRRMHACFKEFFDGCKKHGDDMNEIDRHEETKEEKQMMSDTVSQSPPRHKP